MFSNQIREENRDVLCRTYCCCFFAYAEKKAKDIPKQQFRRIGDWKRDINIEHFVNATRNRERASGGVATLRSICLHVIISSLKVLSRALADDSPLPDDLRQIVWQTHIVRFH
jgi:hypothetical protein